MAMSFHGIVVPASAQNGALSGPAWTLADEAYRAFDARDYATAVEKAREAVGLRPDLVQLRRLLINALSAQGDGAGALREAERAIDDNVSDEELLKTRSALKTQLETRQGSETEVAAYKAADAGYKAYARRDYRAAIAGAQKAISLDSSKPNYHALLVDALQGAGRVADAEREASNALTHFPRNASLRLQRGYLRQRLQRHGGAIVDFSAVLGDRSLSAVQRRNARLSLVDVLLAAKQPQRALDVLAALGRAENYDISIRRGYALQALDRQEEALEAFETALRRAPARGERSSALRGILAALVALDRKEEARVRFNAAYAAGDLRGMSNLDMAYLAGQVGEQALSYDLFMQADAQARVRGQALLDAGYAARGQFDNVRAENFLRRAIDAHHDGEISLDPQRLFEVRREIATLNRVWGATASLFYGSVGVMPGLPPTVPTAGSTLQAGTEFYWRPPGIGFRDGATFELFARAFTTIYDRLDGPTGSDTVQGSFGARWKPFRSVNLVLEIGRLVKIGRFARDDWQLRAGYSLGDGGDLRRDRDNWRYWQFYAEASQFLETTQTLASAEARFGHSFRMDAVHPNLVITPFVAAGAAYDSTLARRSAFGAGPGINVRYWFREDRYVAPMSFVDLSVQYRFRLAGDRRAEGWFGFVSLAY